MNIEKLDPFMAHELIDRLYMLTDMYNDYICEHDSYEFLPLKEREELRTLLWKQYQKASAKADELLNKKSKIQSTK